MKSEWIKVTDRLPSIPDGLNNVEMGLFISTDTGIVDKDIWSFRTNRFMYYDQHNITHWMQIPDFPKEVSND